jgi:predicted nucleotidyltransferase
MQIKTKSDVVITVKKIINRISFKYDIHGVYLFGSYANGEQTEESDIDVAIILNEKVDFDKDFEIFKEAQNFNLDLEPVVYSVSEFNNDLTDIIVEIKQKGEKIA